MAKLSRELQALAQVIHRLKEEEPAARAFLADAPPEAYATEAYRFSAALVEALALAREGLESVWVED